MPESVGSPIEAPFFRKASLTIDSKEIEIRRAKGQRCTSRPRPAWGCEALFLHLSSNVVSPVLLFAQFPFMLVSVVALCVHVVFSVLGFMSASAKLFLGHYLPRTLHL